MLLNTKDNFIPLSTPIPIIEQVWDIGTQPFVLTSTTTYNLELYIRDCI